MSRIVVDKVRVEYPIFNSNSRSLKNTLALIGTGGRIMASAGRTNVLALDNVSFELNEGDRVALIGHNGSGKSTLLRVLAGIYHPSQGQVKVEGKIGAIFDQGYGLDTEATGRENIYLRGLALGMRSREIEARVDEIIEFAELGDFIELPMRTYSAGMSARLAFGVTTTISADVLLIDEGIGAGDTAFLEKANQRISQMVERAGILVLGSHSETLLKHTCNRGILMHHGKMIMNGPLDEVLDCYHGGMPALNAVAAEQEAAK
ncbi:ABC transporter ATP-binding protein [Methylovirgula sp. 4M-Z18]|uniref:ABC transporter ATP-binding protein n=1 Tax=Methylovirgula sp. 4M-Z18 TaxID=2293567 RepID=UPI000E2FC527|nr:ABC transporter ATP-binding protein [Methylovirgula sp. 4M-Z18]RFB78684.1 ABC transporter ATP-binding protein [Methylovirgula sp. 4M-Z18]